ncbi:ejection protein [Pseudanabaena phage Pan3]|nr:ejection protein [Pseudanabaena phage Pan3]
MQVNWNLLQPVDVGGMFERGVQQGRQQRIERETDNALRSYAQNPDDPNAVNALLRFNPQMGMQLQQQQAERQRQQQTRAQTGAALGGDMQALFELAQTDPEQFARVRPQIEQINRTIGQIAAASTTPEQWDANVTRLVEMYGEGFRRYLGRFDLRAVAIAQSGEMQQFLESQAPRYQVVPEGGALVNTRDPAALAQFGAPGAAPAPTAPATGGPLNDAQGGAVLEQAMRAGQISQSDAARVRASMGPNGTAQFENWLRTNNIRIVPDAAPAPPPGFVMDN